MDNKTILPAEWYPQSAVQLTWPHEGTDWAPILDEVVPCFVEIAKEVIKREKLLIVCPDETVVRSQLGEVDYSRDDKILQKTPLPIWIIQKPH